MFRSVREAIGYMVAWESGPQMSRPRYTDAPRGGHRWTSEKAMHMAALVKGYIYGICGVARGGSVDRALRDYATQKGQAPSGRVLDIILGLDKYLIASSNKIPRPSIEKRTKQPAGAELWHLVEWVEMPANRVIRKEWQKIENSA